MNNDEKPVHADMSNYPMAPKDDPRFSDQLLTDVSRVLVAHGYPILLGEDVVHLQKAIHDFLYDQKFANRGWRIPRQRGGSSQ